MDVSSNKDIRYTLPVIGMKCPKCSAHVDEALRALKGVTDVIVSLEDARATVVFDSSSCTAEQITTAVADAGYEVKSAEGSVTENIPVKGMMCMKCVAHVDEALRALKGVSAIIVVLGKGMVTVTYDPSACSAADVRTAITDAGYEVVKADDKTTVTLPVKGMMCMKCAAHVDEAVRNIDGVEQLEVSLDDANITVTFDNAKCSAEIIRDAVTAAGYEMPLDDEKKDNVVTETMPIKGMVCTNCVSHVKKALDAVDGIEEYDVNLKAQCVTVTYDTNKCSADDIRKAVSEAGYEMPCEDGHIVKKECTDGCHQPAAHTEEVTCTVPVTGMHCAACSARVDKTIHGVDGVTGVAVNLLSSNAKISFDSSRCSISDIQKAVRDAGYDLITSNDADVSAAAAGGKSVNCSMPVIGMSCAACAARVNKTLNSVNGVSSASVNFAAASASITYNPSLCSIGDIQQAVRDAGYDLLIEDREQAKAKAEKIRRDHYDRMRRSCIGAWILSVPIMIASMMYPHNTAVQYGVWIASTISIFAFGRTFFISAWKQLMHMSFNMDTLVANSTGIAYLFSVFNLLFPEFWLSHGIEPHLYFETASCLIAFILLGRTLEARAKRRTSASIERLIGLRPKRVTVIRDGEEKMMPISLVQKGDIILVHNGERVALDGKVDEGQTYIDESMLSGEPVPVFKKTGDDVFSGTMNTGEAFKFRAEKVGDETVLAQIIKMVEEAQGSRAQIQNVVDKIAGIFVPAILIIAAVTFCIWYFFAPSEGFSHGLLTMMTVLVIACPCALGLATPTAIMVGIGRGAEAGVLIKDAESLQTARNIDTVVLDKTGTLTEGHPEVVAKFWDDDMLKIDEILSALEHQSDHPLAQAVVRDLKDVTPAKVTDVENIPGVGVKGIVDGVKYYVGSEKYIKEAGIEVSPLMRAHAEKWLDQSHTLVWLANEKKALSIVALNDKLKETSAEAVSRLHSMGIDVCLLTGDNQRSAEVVAKKVGITDVRAGVLPQDKAAYIKELRSKGKHVAMVGDGINDSAALANADLSIAMGHGSDVAIDAAGVTILSSDLVKISEMIRLSQATMRILHQNLFWALIYNSICIPVAAGVLYPFFGILLHPMIGGAAMAFSSVSVVTNSLRLARVRLSK